MTTNINNLIVTTAVKLMALEEADLEAKWHVFVKRTEKTEDKFKPKLQTVFTKQEKAVLAKLKGKRIPDTSDAEKSIVYMLFKDNEAIFKASEEAEKFVDQIYTASAWQEPFTVVMQPFVTEAFKEAGDAAFVEIGLEGAFNVTNPTARKFLKDRVFDSVKGINEETREKLKRALIKGFDAGEGIPEISKRIAGVFDINRGSRTDKIARTEIVGASNNGTHQAYVASEIVETKIWIDSRDANVRVQHRIDGQERKLNKRYSNGLLHPHDPSGLPGNVINCRCTETAGKLKEAA